MLKMARDNTGHDTGMTQTVNETKTEMKLTTKGVQFISNITRGKRDMTVTLIIRIAVLEQVS